MIFYEFVTVSSVMSVSTGETLDTTYNATDTITNAAKIESQTDAPNGCKKLNGPGSLGCGSLNRIETPKFIKGLVKETFCSRS